eukprot:COSAG02_NODE_47779_length_338_cov_1.502092_1_plen_27_part_10
MLNKVSRKEKVVSRPPQLEIRSHEGGA